ncbi:hypothetical protein ACRAVF_18930 [Bradyrhizobium oligotrophicum S58]
MANPVTDPALLAQLNAPEPAQAAAPKGAITDPALLAQLNGVAAPASASPVASLVAEKSTLQTIREAIHAPTRVLENGVMLGLGDRARALIDTVVSGPRTLAGLVTGEDNSYAANLKRQQDETAKFAEDHPIAAPVIEGVGGIIAPLGVIKAASVPATLGMKTLAGMGTGAALGGVQGVTNSKDWTDLPQVAKDAAIGAGIGGVLGGAIPGTSAAVGAAYRKVTDAMRGRVEGMSRGASSHLIRAVETDSPVAVRARLDELGPDAMLVDAGPALLGTGQGALGNSMEARSTLTTALKARDAGTNARIQADVNQALGPAEDPQTITNAIKAHRTAVDNVNYPAALDTAPPVQVAPILRQIDGALLQTPAGSMEHKALTNARSMLMTTERRPLLDSAEHPQYDHLGNQRWTEVPVSQNDANVLHKVKGELDNVIEYDAPGLGVPAGALQRQQGALKQVRGALNAELESQVPGYADANRASAALAQRAEAVQAGTQLLSNGKTSPSPGRFAAEFDPLEQGTKIAFAKGNRGDIERILGQKANDLVALKGALQGEGGWNTANLAKVHGQGAADELVGTVNRNTAFRDTHTKISENSQTDLRNAARKEMKPDPSTDTPLINPNSTITGVAGTAVKMGVQKIVNALTRSDPTRHYGEVARALTLQGADRDARLLAVVDALNRRQGNVAGAETAGKIGAVTAALLERAAAERLRNGPSQRPQ